MTLEEKLPEKQQECPHEIGKFYYTVNPTTRKVSSKGRCIDCHQDFDITTQYQVYQVKETYTIVKKTRTP